MEYAQQQENPNRGRNAIGGAPSAIEKPRIAQQIDHLAKVLAECHNLAGSIENVADRMLGPVPQDATKGVEKAAIDTLERRLSDTIHNAEVLVARLQSASNRLNSAI